MKRDEYVVRPWDNESPPVRGAWIETQFRIGMILIDKVAPRAGGVD